MRRLIFGGIISSIVMTALVFTIFSDDDSFLNDDLLPDKTFQVEIIEEKKKYHCNKLC